MFGHVRRGALGVHGALAVELRTFFHHQHVALEAALGASCREQLDTIARPHRALEMAAHGDGRHLHLSVHFGGFSDHELLAVAYRAGELAIDPERVVEGDFSGERRAFVQEAFQALQRTRPPATFAISADVGPDLLASWRSPSPKTSARGAGC